MTLQAAIAGRQAKTSDQTLPIALRMGRVDLPQLCRKFDLKRGAEIGVWKGAYSEKFLRAGVQMICVDPWESYPAWLDTKNALPTDQAKAFMEAARIEAYDRLQRYHATIIRKYSTEAAHDIPDASLDFVYIDGNHGYTSVLVDLHTWAPKVRRGGFVAGHDYRRNPRKPFIQVIEAVQEFTKTEAIAPWYVLAKDPTPSFFWIQQR